MAYSTKEKEKAYAKIWYERNKKKRIKQILEYKQRQRDKVRDYKISRGCKVCGYNKCSGALDFHHLDPDKKDFVISAQRKGTSWGVLIKEIEKCVVLCKNCHAEVHEGLISLCSSVG